MLPPKGGSYRTRTDYRSDGLSVSCLPPLARAAREMETYPLSIDIPWMLVLSVLVGAYAVSVGTFLLLENRSPQSTFAWLFLFLVFPIGGLVIYALFGRSRHAFSGGR